MMKQLLVVVALLCAAGLHAQTTKVPLDEIGNYIGKTVTVCGQVSGGRAMPQSKGDSLTLINVGGAYPQQKLTIVIQPENRRQFPYQPEQQWKNRSLCFTGTVELFKGKPQIAITSPSAVGE